MAMEQFRIRLLREEDTEIVVREATIGSGIPKLIGGLIVALTLATADAVAEAFD